MKYSLNLADYYSETDMSAMSGAEVVQRIGAQLGAVEDVEDWSLKYKGVVVAKVVSCEKHPDADKLSLCFIDDGGVTPGVQRNDSGHVQVVCGAPNVREGIFVAWIPPSATVPCTVNDADPFVLGSRELRGKVSNGMLGSAKELDISSDHDGILEITESNSGVVPIEGHSLTKYFGLDDYVIDCENKMFTHRPDCFGNLGIAREVAAIFGQKFISPNWYTETPTFEDASGIDLKISNDAADKVPRFTAVAMNGIKVTPSSMWMQASLHRVGIKPINNVVDVTNYVMHLTGQPLHAFDYDKLVKISGDANVNLHPRMAAPGEKMTLLGNKEITLNEQDIVISAGGTPVALAGVMGGMDSEVDEHTTNIVIECANFDMYAVRRMSMRHGLFTDAVTRFNKGQSPLQNDKVLAFAMNLMTQQSGAKPASGLKDITAFDLDADNLSKVSVSVEFINSRLGSNLGAQEITTLLENAEFTVVASGQNLSVTAPFWRMDIAIKEDLVEEVGRLYGYDNLPINLPPRDSQPAPLNVVRTFKNGMRSTLSALGCNEVLTYSFVHGKLLKAAGVDADKWAYHLRNALSPDLQYYRTSLAPSLLAKVNSSIRSQAGSSSNEFAIYEFGKAHVKGHFEQEQDDLPKQMRRLAFVIAADKKTASKYNGSAYYMAKQYLDKVTQGQCSYEPLDNFEYPITAPYQVGRSATVSIDGQVLGVIGELNAQIKKSLKLPDYCAAFELDTDLLMQYMAESKYKPLSQFPSSSQDMTFEVAADLPWARLHDLVHAEIAVAAAEDHYSYNLQPLDIFAQKEDSTKKRISFRLELVSSIKTLKTQEVSNVVEHISKAAEAKYSAVRI